MILGLVAVVFARYVGADAIDAARAHAEQGLAGSMEGHAAMDMSVGGDGAWWRRLTTPAGLTAVSHIFVMEWGAVLRDVVVGLLVAGALEAWVPTAFWSSLFLTSDPFWSAVVGPLIAPLVGVLSFVCSVGNVPLAGVLWNGGASFGGVMAFVFADLLIVPILLIYRKYYGTAMMLRILGVFYATMVVGAYVVEALFWALSLTPEARDARGAAEGLSWNYTTYLDLLLGVVAVVLVARSFTRGGVGMLRMMGGDPATAPH